MHTPSNRVQRTLALTGVTISAAVLLAGCGSVQSVSHYLTDAPKAVPAAMATDAAGGRLPAYDGPGQEVYRGRFSYVRIVPAEAGAQTSAPLLLDEDRLRGLLKELLGGASASFSDRPLFSRDEVAELVPPLRTALANARSGEDVVFAVSGTHKPLSLNETASVTTGRLFVADGRLNLIFGMTRVNFGDALRDQGVLRSFVQPGRRVALASAEEVRAPSWQTVNPARPDWLGVPLDVLGVLPQAMPAASAALPSANMAASVTAPPGPGSGTPVVGTPTVSSTSGGRRPIALTTPTAAPTAAAAATATAASPDDSGSSAERRLATLERLRQKGLITEQEYATKRQTVLDGL